MSETYMSREGYEKLHKELEGLRKEKARLSGEIGEAASQGDLSENFAYHAAKKDQADILRRIDETEKKLRSARLIEELNIPQGEVRIGAKVTLEDAKGNRDQWTLVGADEADAAQGKISVHAPLSQGLLGHKEGETVEITLPRGKQTYKVIKVEKAS